METKERPRLHKDRSSDGMSSDRATHTVSHIRHCLECGGFRLQKILYLFPYTPQLIDYTALTI
jgi:hypothetical protein